MLSHESSTHDRRTGFTLVEIMVVMVIIGLLAAILVPVLGSIIQRTNEAAVKVEINSLENAITDFKTKYGCEPPDHITLYEFSNSNVVPPTGWAGDTASRAKIIRIWPRFRFDLQRDYLDRFPGANGEIYLSGAECLVFFLGGMPVGHEDVDNDGVLDSGEDRNGNGILDIGFYTTGFSKNPTNPFQHRTGDESRDGPFFEFPSARLVDVEVDSNGDRVGDGWPEFIDTLSNQTAPYLYLSSSEGRGFSPAGGWVFHSNPNLPAIDPVTRPSFNMWPEIAPTKTPHWNRTSPYRQSATGPRWKARTFQIISPGYGPHENSAGQVCPYGTDEVYDPENTGVLSPVDADNITNFSAGGRLKP